MPCICCEILFFEDFPPGRIVVLYWYARSWPYMAIRSHICLRGLYGVPHAPAMLAPNVIGGLRAIPSHFVTRSYSPASHGRCFELLLARCSLARPAVMVFDTKNTRQQALTFATGDALFAKGLRSARGMLAPPYSAWCYFLPCFYGLFQPVGLQIFLLFNGVAFLSLSLFDKTYELFDERFLVIGVMLVLFLHRFLQVKC